MTFKEQLVEDAKDVFLNEDGGFVEDVVYTPYGGSPVTIKAVVTRTTLQTNQQGSNAIVGRDAEIEVLNDADDGITSVDKGRDVVSMSVRRGESSVSWSVVEVISKDEAMFHLKVRR